MVGPDPDLEVSQLVMPTRASQRPAYLQVPGTTRKYREEGGISPLSTPKCSREAEMGHHLRQGPSLGLISPA